MTISPDTKAPYFYNKNNGLSTWKHPRRREHRNILVNYFETKDEDEFDLERLYSYLIRSQTDDDSLTDSVDVENVKPSDLKNLLKQGAFNPETGLKKTFLLVDPAEIFLRYFQDDANFSFVILDAKKMHFDKYIRKVKMPVILEEARRKLAYAMMKGKVLVVDMGDIAVDFLSTFHDDAVPNIQKQLPNEITMAFEVELGYLPYEFIFEAGDILRVNQWPEKLYRRAEVVKHKGEKINVYNYELSDFKCHEAFQVMFLTSIQKVDVVGKLFNGKVGLPDFENFEVLTGITEEEL